MLRNVFQQLIAFLKVTYALNLAQIATDNICARLLSLPVIFVIRNFRIASNGVITNFT